MATQKVEQFWRSLEAKIQCPTCKIRLTGSVYMCGSGHSICNVCTQEGSVCMQCRAPYTKIPNLLVQDLLQELNNMKENLKEMIDLKKKPTELTSTMAKINLNKSGEAKNGKYRCWVTDTCHFTADVSAIIEHFKNDHISQFEENTKGNLPYTKSWEMDYFIGKNLDHIIKIEGLVFIIHISINGIGELGACVLMYTSDTIAHQHLCQIEIECDKKKLCYKNAKVVSAQAPSRVILGFKRSGLQVARNANMYNALREYNRFKCTVLIEKKYKTTEQVKKSRKQTKKGIENYQEFNKSIDDFEIVNDCKQVTNKQQLNVDPLQNNNRKIASLDSSAESDGSLSVITDRSKYGRGGEVADCVLV